MYKESALKDFFIPHKGNNYKPKSLHHHRLIGHVLGAIAVKVLIVFTVLALPMQAWLTPDVEVEQSQKIIELTNETRADLKLAPLKENTKLSSAALLKAEDMLDQQYFAHVGPDKKSLRDWLKLLSYNFSVAGENLAMGFSCPEDVMKAWINSPTHYSNIIDPEFTEIGVGAVSGSFLGADSTMIAQYFGLPRTTSRKAKVAGAVTSNNESVANGDDSRANKLIVVEAPAAGETLVRAVAYAAPDAKEAKVNINGYEIILERDDSDTTLWAGRAILSDQEKNKIFKPIVPPTLTIMGANGEKTTVDMAIDGLKPITPSLISQYFFIRSQSDGLLGPLFSVSSTYFKFLAGFLIIALLLNIFIEIRHQHPHIIASGLGALVILILLIII